MSAHEIQIRELGTKEHLDVSVSLHTFAGALQAEGKPREAIDTFRRALRIGADEALAARLFTVLPTALSREA